MTAQVFINGKREEIDTPTSLGDLLDAKRIRPEVCSVAVNRTFLKRDEVAEAQVADGDTVEIMIQLAGGSLDA